jgi:hypothetical protein
LNVKQATLILLLLVTRSVFCAVVLSTLHTSVGSPAVTVSTTTESIVRADLAFLSGRPTAAAVLLDSSEEEGTGLTKRDARPTESDSKITRNFYEKKVKGSLIVVVPTLGVMWCQNTARKWSLCSVLVPRDERKGHRMVVVSVFLSISLIRFFKKDVNETAFSVQI